MEPVMTLKYGCNPQQKPSVIYSTVGAKMPFKVINGTPGYVDAMLFFPSWANSCSPSPTSLSIDNNLV